MGANVWGIVIAVVYFGEEPHIFVVVFDFISKRECVKCPHELLADLIFVLFKSILSFRLLVFLCVDDKLAIIQHDFDFTSYSHFGSRVLFLYEIVI